MTRFVNPYGFVPLPPTVSRSRPEGHLRHRRGNVSGHIMVRLTATSPVSVGGALHASSLHGAVRSLHESLSGSCLRVLDDELVPRYREFKEDANAKLVAIVDSYLPQTASRPASAKVRISDQGADYRINVRLSALRTAALRRGDPDALWQVRTGARVDIDVTEFERGHRGPPILSRAEAITFNADGAYVLLIADAAAPQRRNAMALRADAFDTPVQVPTEVLSDFASSLRGSIDSRSRPAYADEQPPPRLDADGRTWVPVHLDRQLVGWRLAPGGPIDDRDRVAPSHPLLQVGQPVFVHTDQSQRLVTRLTLTSIGRHVGRGSVADRVRDAGPCTNDAELCPSCQIFGSAEIRHDHAGDPDAETRALQHSYAGHVSFGEPAFDDPGLEPIEICLPRVDGPKPGAGQFYLGGTRMVSTTSPAQLPNVEALPASAGRPAREWGSSFDDGELRPIRGRKHYWTSSWESRERRLPAHGEEKRPAYPQGTAVTFRVDVENLTAAQLGGLLCALCPSLWAAACDAPSPDLMRLRVGGGKAYGLGATATSVELTTFDPSQRWAGLPADSETISVSDAVRAFVDSVPAETKEETWPALLALLTTDHVGGGQISYPPPHRGEEHPFTVWRDSVGHQQTEHHRDVVLPLVVLPTSSAGSDAQVLDTEDFRKIPR